MRRLLLAALLCALPAACTRTAPLSFALPPATAPVAAYRVGLADWQDLLVLLRDLRAAAPQDNLLLQPAYSLNFPAAGSEMLFAEVAPPGYTRSLPVICRRDGRGLWQIAPLEAESLANCGWVHVAAGPGPGEIWGLLDSFVEDLGPTLYFLHSRDGGLTWRLVSGLEKCCYPAAFEAFALDAAGTGRLTLRLEDDYSDSLPRGYYHYRTRDGGRTWSGPVYEADALTAAGPYGVEPPPDNGRPPDMLITSPPSPPSPPSTRATRATRATRSTLKSSGRLDHGRTDP